jgi:hypothetical protein
LIPSLTEQHGLKIGDFALLRAKVNEGRYRGGDVPWLKIREPEDETGKSLCCQPVRETGTNRGPALSTREQRRKAFRHGLRARQKYYRRGALTSATGKDEEDTEL